VFIGELAQIGGGLGLEAPACGDRRRRAAPGGRRRAARLTSRDWSVGCRLIALMATLEDSNGPKRALAAGFASGAVFMLEVKFHFLGGGWK